MFTLQLVQNIDVYYWLYVVICSLFYFLLFLIFEILVKSFSSIIIQLRYDVPYSYIMLH